MHHKGKTRLWVYGMEQGEEPRREQSHVVFIPKRERRRSARHNLLLQTIFNWIFFFSFFFRTCKMSFKYLNSGGFFFNLLVTHNFFHSDFSQHFKKNLHAHSGLNLTNTWHRQKTKPPLMYSTVLSAFTSMNYRKYFLPQGKEQDPTFKVWNGNAWLLFSRLPT